MRSPRTVIAFAYVHDQFTKTNDIAVGLIPLFAPIISARAGKPFDPMQFVRDVKTLYDLDMHPYVAEELAPSLAQHGYLIAERRVGSTPQYVNRSITLRSCWRSENGRNHRTQLRRDLTAESEVGCFNCV